MIIFGSITLVITGQQAVTGEQGQLCDRYAKAANLLTSDNEYAHIVGVEEMTRVARDFPAEGSTVVSMLAAFVRDQAPLAYSDVCQTRPQPGSGVIESLGAISQLNSVRGYTEWSGWHRHVTLTSIAQAICTQLRRTPKAPAQA